MWKSALLSQIRDIVGVALQATYRALCHSSEVGDQCSFSTVLGVNTNLLLAMCSHPCLSWVSGVEPFDCECCIVEVCGGVLDFVFFWSVFFPLGSVLELVVVESRVDDFVEFVFIFSFYLNRWRWLLEFWGELLFLVRFEKRNVSGVVCLYRQRKGQLKSACFNPCQEFEWWDFLVVQFPRWSCDVDVAW